MNDELGGYAAALLGYFPQERSSCTAREETKRLLRGLHLSIVLLSIWGASLLPIDSFLSIPTYSVFAEGDFPSPAKVFLSLKCGVKRPALSRGAGAA